MATMRDRFKEIFESQSDKYRDAESLAKQSGVSGNVVRNLLGDRSDEPKLADGIRLAWALGVSPERLAFGDQAEVIRRRVGADSPSDATESHWLADEVRRLKDRMALLEPIVESARKLVDRQRKSLKSGRRAR